MSISFTAHLQAASGRKEGTGGTTCAAERAHLQEGRAALRLEAQLGTREITTPRDTRRGGLAAVDARYRGATAAEKLRTDVEHRPGVSKPANSSRGGPLPGDLRRAGRRDEWRRPGGLTRNLSHRALAWGLVLEGSRRSPTRAAWRLPQAPQSTGFHGRVHGSHPRPASSSSGPRDPGLTSSHQLIQADRALSR